MRYQGRITDWKDNQGFGFITPNGGGATVFLHISALSSGQPRPIGNELVTYELGQDSKERPRALNVAFVESGKRKVQRRGYSFPLQKVLSLLFVGVIGWYGYQKYERYKVRAHDIQPQVQQEVGLQPAIAAAKEAQFRCDGRTHCSKMTSCEEAKYFLNNCPNTEMDGDGDGIPCEKQLCN